MNSYYTIGDPWQTEFRSKIEQTMRDYPSNESTDEDTSEREIFELRILLKVERMKFARDGRVKVPIPFLRKGQLGLVLGQLQGIKNLQASFSHFELFLEYKKEEIENA